MWPAKIFLIPTVLAENTADTVITDQIKQLLPTLRYFFVENIRSTRRFISSLKLGIVIDDLIFFEVDKDTPITTIREYFKEVGNVEIGVISEAGCPGIADPGALIVKLAHQLNISVVPLVGPSSILLALMASGFSGQSFVFHGYLPIEKETRRKFIKEIEHVSKKIKQTQLFIETPFRNQSLYEDILITCAGDTLLCLAVNITASDEFIKTLSISEWKKERVEIHKKPALFLLFANN